MRAIIAFFIGFTIYLGASGFCHAAPGDILWSYQTGVNGNEDKGADSSPVIGDDGTLYFGADDNMLYAFAPDGVLKWQYEAGGAVDSPAMGSDGTIYFTARDNYTYALTPEGSLKWRYNVNSHTHTYQAIATPVVGVDGTVYTAGPGGLYALDPDGLLRWSYTQHKLNIESTPAIDAEGTIYFCTGGTWTVPEGYIYALNPDGTLKWELRVEGSINFSSPAVNYEGTLYVGTTNRKLYAVNLDGTLKWVFQAEEGSGSGIWSSPTVGPDGTIYFSMGVNTDPNIFYAINPDGTEKWQQQVYVGMSSALVGADGTVYAGGYAFNSDGSIKWNANIQPWFSSPALSGDGRLYVGSGEGVIYAVETDANSGLAQAPWPKFKHDARNTGRALVDSLAPVLDPIGDRAASEGQLVQIELSGSDPDGDPLTYLLSGAPAGATLAGTTFSWTPTYWQAGVYELTFAVTDGQDGRRSEKVQLTVSDVLNLSSSELSFGPTWVDSTESKTLVLRNAGTESVRIDSAVTAAPFHVVNGGQQVIAVGDSAVLEVQFTPLQDGTLTGSLSLLGGTLGATGVTVSAVGEARYPNLRLSAESLDFGQLLVGESASRFLTLTNGGVATMTISNIIPADPQYSVSSSSFALTPGAARDITVTYTPIEGRTPNSTLTIITDDGEMPLRQVALSASLGSTSEDPSIAVFPSVLDFGSISLGQSKSLSLIVSNEGGGTLRTLNIVGSSGSVTVSETGFRLAAGEETVLTVSLQPTQLGSASETLNIPSNDPELAIIQIPLRATVERGGGQPTLSLSVAQLAFGQVEVGATSEFLLPVSNEGSATLVVSNAVSDNTQVVVSPTSVSVLPQETRSLTVRFYPLPGRERSGRVTLFSNDSLQPQVGLSWSAQDVASPYLSVISMSPADGSFGVAESAELELRFSEPLFHRRGFTALDAQLRPVPLSGPLMDSMEVRGDGSMVVFPVELARDQVYRLVVYGATGWSGLELFDMVETTFSTGAAPPVVANLSGSVAIEEGQALTGSIYLFDAAQTLSSQTSVSLDGSFTLEGISEGRYTLFLEGTLGDAPVGGAYDADGDGRADAISVVAGIDQEALSVVPIVRQGANPVVATNQVQVDLDEATGNQRQTTVWDVAGEQDLVLEVYASDVEQLTGSAVTVTYDTSAVYLMRTEEGEHLLSSGEGQALYLTRVDPSGSVEFGGSILGPTEETAVDGSGLLGRFHFATVPDFIGPAALTVTHLTLNTLTGKTKTDLEVSARVESGGEETHAEGPVSVDFDPAGGDQGQRAGGSAVAGKTYTLELHVADAPEIDGWSVLLSYDPSQVAYVRGSFATSDFIGSLIPLVDEQVGQVSVGGAVLGIASSASGDGYLGNLSFEVLEGFSGETELVVMQVGLNRVDTGEEIHVVRHRVTITVDEVIGALVGDFNSDGKVDFSDFFLFADGFGTTDPTYDLTSDGKVDFSDFFLFADGFGREARAKLMALAQKYLGLPQMTTLKPNYPNPFNGETTIPFVLSSPGDAELAVFDLSGQRVVSLHRGYLDAGRYALVWDGLNGDGRPVASGVYLVYLQTVDIAIAQKITLLQ